ncbi:MAG TPA: Vps62-related protein [Rickettsiales bacterium]|nr:Vps62-related protein [Rickettsiales bacterium]
MAYANTPVIISGITGKSITLEELRESGVPALQFAVTNQYDLVWWGSKMHGSCSSVRVYRPLPPDDTWSIVSYCAVYGSNPPPGPALIVQEVNRDPQNPILMPPNPQNPFFEIWNDRDTGGSQNGSIWIPQAPQGYYFIGNVANGQGYQGAFTGYEMPIIPDLMCVRADLCTVTQATYQIWNDHTSGASFGNAAFWALNGIPNAFVTGTDYDGYEGTAYIPKGVPAIE